MNHLLTLTLGNVLASCDDERAHLPNIADTLLETSLAKIGREFNLCIAACKSPLDDYDYWSAMQQYCELWCDNLVKRSGDKARLYAPLATTFLTTK